MLSIPKGETLAFLPYVGGLSSTFPRLHQLLNDMWAVVPESVQTLHIPDNVALVSQLLHWLDVPNTRPDIREVVALTASTAEYYVAEVQCLCRDQCALHIFTIRRTAG